MEKIRKQKSYRRSYGPVVIWLEDLTEIVALLKENCKDVQISTESYKFGTVDELKEHLGSAVQFALEIDGSGPYVSVDFNRRSATLHVSAGAQAAYIFDEIDTIVARRQRRFPTTYRLSFLMAVLVISLAGSYFLQIYLAVRSGPVADAYNAVQIALSLWFVWATFVTSRRTSVINLQRRSEARPFFDRIKDQLALLLIGACIGGVVTFGGVVAKEHFYPSVCVVKQP